MENVHEKIPLITRVQKLEDQLNNEVEGLQRGLLDIIQIFIEKNPDMKLALDNHTQNIQIKELLKNKTNGQEDTLG